MKPPYDMPVTALKRFLEPKKGKGILTVSIIVFGFVSFVMSTNVQSFHGPRPSPIEASFWFPISVVLVWSAWFVMDFLQSLFGFQPYHMRLPLIILVVTSGIVIVLFFYYILACTIYRLFHKLSKRTKKLAICTVIGFTLVLIGLSFATRPEYVPSPHYAIQLSNEHIWVSPNGTSSVAGFVVQNTGSVVVAIENITVRGQSVPVASWYYNNSTTFSTAANLQRELKYDDSLNGIDVTGDTLEEQFTQASGPIELQPGQALFLYLANPADIAAAERGQAFTLYVVAGKASSVESVSVIDG
jgi:hypothetical protein